MDQLVLKTVSITRNYGQSDSYIPPEVFCTRYNYGLNTSCCTCLQHQCKTKSNKQYFMLANNTCSKLELLATVLPHTHYQLGIHYYYMYNIYSCWNTASQILNQHFPMVCIILYKFPAYTSFIVWIMLKHLTSNKSLCSHSWEQVLASAYNT